jgi:hypothetical protein
MTDNWIQHAIKHPGRVRRYIAREYGEDCFTEDGDIKMSCLDEAINDVKEECEERHTEQCLSLLRALELAKRLKEMHHK